MIIFVSKEYQQQSGPARTNVAGDTAGCSAGVGGTAFAVLHGVIFRIAKKDDAGRYISIRRTEV